MEEMPECDAGNDNGIYTTTTKMKESEVQEEDEITEEMNPCEFCPSGEGRSVGDSVETMRIKR